MQIVERILSQRFIDGVGVWGFHLVGKLREDTNLRYLYEGPRAHSQELCMNNLGGTFFHLQTINKLDSLNDLSQLVKTVESVPPFLCAST